MGFKITAMFFIIDESQLVNQALHALGPFFVNKLLVRIYKCLGEFKWTAWL